MKIESVKAVIFDWNGTLLDDLGLAYLSVQEIFRRYGREPPSIEDYRREIEADFMKFYHAHGIPKDATADELNAIREEVFRRHWDEVDLQPGVKEAIAHCLNLRLRLAITSGEIPEVLLSRLLHFDLTDHFEVIRAGAWHKKEALRETVERLSVRNDQACYIDDTFGGLSVAKTLGIVTVGFTRGYNTRERILAAEPDFTINRLTELIKLFACSNR